MAQIIGITLAKINHVYDVEVTDSDWDVERVVHQKATGAGYQSATGLEKGSGNFTRAVPRAAGATAPIRALTDFTIDIYDQETQSFIVASFSQCNWTKRGGSSATEGANTTSKWSWVSNVVNKNNYEG